MPGSELGKDTLLPSLVPALFIPASKMAVIPPFPTGDFGDFIALWRLFY